MIPGSEVMAYVGLGGLESQGRSYELHPIVGETVRPSHQAISGWWSPYLSSPPGGLVLSTVWCRDGACSETAVPSILAN